MQRGVWGVLLIVWLALSTSVLAEEEHPSFAKPPAFCHGLGCPYYEVVETTREYEVRKYAKSNWVSTEVESPRFIRAQGIGFRALFDYIDGSNVESKKIKMTCPVRTMVTPGEGPFCKSKFTVSFFAVETNIEDVPKPTKLELFVEGTPAITVYVTVFGGFMKDGDVVRRSAKLAKLLKDKGIEVESNYYASGYDSPFRLYGRHNEIWLVAKEASTVV